MGRSEEIEKAARKTIKLIRELAGYEVGSMHPNDFAVRDEEVTHDVLRLHAEHGTALWKWRWKMGRSAACETCGGDGEVDESETGFPIYKRMSPCPDCTPPAEAEYGAAIMDNDLGGPSMPPKPTAAGAFGIKVVEDPTMPDDEIELRTPTERVRVTNVGPAEAAPREEAQEGGDPAERRIDAKREEGRFASLDPWDWAIDALNDYECSAGIEAEDRDELRSILHRMFRDYGQARAGQCRKMPTVEEVGDVIRRCVFCDTWDPLEGTASAARAVLRLLGEE